MKKRILSALALLMVVLCILTSCGGEVHACELSKGYGASTLSATYKDGRSILDDDFDSFVLNYMDVAMSVFSATDTEETNTVLSPLTLSVLLGMIGEGANGGTRDEIEALLGQDVDTFLGCMAKYMNSLKPGKGVDLNMGNSLWILENANIKNDYLDSVCKRISPDIYRTYDDILPVNEINKWIEKSTDGMIKNAVRSIPENTVMMLVSALMFDAEWAEKYEKDDISERVFYGTGGEATADFLGSTEKTYFETDGAKGFVKPYKSGNFSFLALLPDEGNSVSDLINALDGQKWAAMWQNKRSASIDIAIPEFSFNCDLDLSKALSALGVEKMFDPDFADFSNMSEQELYVGIMEQKNTVEVNRHGTKMASISFGGMCTEGEPSILVFDRPFLFAVVDNNTGLPIFIGVLNSIE